jgi:hypothetical protein
MKTPEALIKEIEAAFSSVESPPKWSLVNSGEGDAPKEIAAKLVAVPAWGSLTPDFLNNLGPALAFFSDEAFRYYLPAFLVASVKGETKSVNADPLFTLTHGLDQKSAQEKLNPRRYGERKWGDYVRFRFSVLSGPQVRAVVSYLRREMASSNRSSLDKVSIREALANYWNHRLDGEG